MNFSFVFAASMDSWLDWAAQQPLLTVAILTFILLAIGQLLRPTLLGWLGLQLDDSVPAPLPPAEKPEVTREEKPEPVIEEPKAEEPVEEEPEEEPEKEPEEEPKAEEPKEEPKAEEPKEEPVEEKEEPKAEEPKAEEPKAEEPKVELGDGEHPTVIKAPKRTKERKPRRNRKNKKAQEVQSEEAKEQRRQRTEELLAKRKMTVDDLEIKEENHEPRTLHDGLDKTRKGWISKLNQFLLGQKELTDEMLEELEEILYTADIGTRTTQRLLQSLEEKLEGKDLNDMSLLKQVLKDEVYKILDLGAPALDVDAHDPFVIMVVGVNGAGKTTSIGKLAARYRKQGKSVLIGAADTFRAAAVDQLEIWAERVGAELIRGGDGTDPSSVVFDAVQAAKARNIDVVFLDTAGRLQTQTNLMEELKKIKRVIGKAHQGAPHEVMLVLDANTGQNAISQAKEFNNALEVNGITLTKLDGTAKGGVVIGISEDLQIPIRFIGVGEHIDELRAFSANEFVEALL